MWSEIWVSLNLGDSPENAAGLPPESTDVSRSPKPLQDLLSKWAGILLSSGSLASWCLTLVLWRKGSNPVFLFVWGPYPAMLRAYNCSVCRHSWKSSRDYMEFQRSKLYQPRARQAPNYLYYFFNPEDQILIQFFFYSLLGRALSLTAWSLPAFHPTDSKKLASSLLSSILPNPWIPLSHREADWFSFPHFECPIVGTWQV